MPEADDSQPIGDSSVVIIEIHPARLGAIGNSERRSAAPATVRVPPHIQAARTRIASLALCSSRRRFHLMTHSLLFRAFECIKI